MSATKRSAARGAAHRSTSYLSHRLAGLQTQRDLKRLADPLSHQIGQSSEALTLPTYTQI